MAEEDLTARQRWMRRIDNLLAKSYNLGVTTGAEVLTVVFWDENFHHFATEGLEPMINQDSGRKLLIKMMTPKEKLKPGQAPPPPPEPLPDPVVDPVVPEVDTESSQFIENLEEREKAFKEQVKWLVKEAEDLSYLKRPAKQAEVLVLVATPSQKVVSWATPKLEPLFKTEQGRTLLSSILTTSSPMAPPLPTPATAAPPAAAPTSTVAAPKAE